MSESEDEAAARDLVERELGVALTFADVDGQVDYLFTDAGGRAGALEVTTLTDQKMKEARVAHRTKSPGYRASGRLTACWDVAVDERDARYNGLVDRLEPPLAALEQADVPADRWWMIESLWDRAGSDPERAAVRRLALAKVTMLNRRPADLCSRDPATQMCTRSTSAWSPATAPAAATPP
ncbi:MAG TPA: hypothetical protein PLZ93_05215 [Nocardioides sp.]|uniref:hypothetical protein n=1 Tax=uncultured Nocardioides sp. TaxID=198441 RepID=UPI000EE636E1|nr:hypothetical protein [uncultured Nocardioides sp.]HCB03180.1 hypothetical protein [Nocardioides sp.]HRI94988.1 hypothetical protein [Nocardioides sp.]